MQVGWYQIPHTHTHTQLEYDTSEWFGWWLRSSSLSQPTYGLNIWFACTRTHAHYTQVYTICQFTPMYAWAHARVRVCARAYEFAFNIHPNCCSYNIIWTQSATMIWMCFVLVHVEMGGLLTWLTGYYIRTEICNIFNTIDPGNIGKLNEALRNTWKFRIFSIACIEIITFVLQIIWSDWTLWNSFFWWLMK